MKNWICAKEGCFHHRKNLASWKERYPHCCSGCRRGLDHTPNCTGYDPCGLPRLEDSTDRKRKGSACDENESKRHRVCDLSSDEDDDSQYEKDLALFNLKGNVYLTEELLNINYRYVVKKGDKLPDRVAVSREEAIAAYERLQHKLVNEDTDQS